MQKLIELFDCVWGSIEAAGAMAKRPQGPWRHRAGAPLTPASRLKQFPAPMIAFAAWLAARSAALLGVSYEKYQDTAGRLPDYKSERSPQNFQFFLVDRETGF